VAQQSTAQKDTLAASVWLSEVEIFAGAGFTAEDFIEKVKADTTFYKAFLNLRYYDHQTIGKLKVQNRRDKDIGEMYREADHIRDGKLFYVNLTTDSTNGKVLNRKGEYRFYTAEMFDQAFYPDDTLTASNNVGDFQEELENGSRMDKNKHQIRLMMFNPGSAVDGVPLIGKKMAIFTDEMAQYYDFNIAEYYTEDSIACYAFSCIVKPEYPASKTVIKELTSYFNQETMQIMEREYHMKYNSALFQFNVRIRVTLDLIKEELVPTDIAYSGFWDVPTKKAEYIAFTLKCFNYTIR